MARDLGERNREWYARYKDDVKKEGKAFYPRAMLHDTVMGFVAVLVTIGLACIWYYDADGTEPGLLGPLVHGAGGPGDDGLHPAARLVLLLPLLPPPDLRVAGDGVHRDRRHPDGGARPPARAPVLRPAAGAASVPAARGDDRRRPDRPLDGRPHVEGRDREGGARLRARRARSRVGGGAGLRGRRPGRRRRRALRAVRLPELPHVPRPGRRQPRRAGSLRDRADERRRSTSSHYLANPAQFGNTVMGSYSYLGQENLEALGVFLEASKGGDVVATDPDETTTPAGRRPAAR